jgi:hypothetical protein
MLTILEKYSGGPVGVNTPSPRQLTRNRRRSRKSTTVPVAAWVSGPHAARPSCHGAGL